MKLFLIFSYFIFSGDALNIDCGSFYNNHDWNILGTLYACGVRSSQIISNDPYLTGFTGTHTSGNSNANVKEIAFYNNCHHIKSVLKNIHEVFPNFIAISFTNCGISKLIGDELNEYRNLQAFWLHGTNLERVPGNLFAFNPNLKLVSFISNKITRIGANLLEPIQNSLVLVYLSNNICVNLDAHTPATISSLINHIRIYCADYETLSEDQNEELTSDEKIHNLKMENSALKSKIKYFEEKYEKIN
jgi:hypothetical protein